MLAEYPPFLNSYGSVQSILRKIQETPVPDRFTHDFLSETLGFRRDADRPFVPLARRMGFLQADGRPTDLYVRFRNPRQSREAMMTAVKNAFPQLYQKNESVHDLDKKALLALVAEITGLLPTHPTARAIVGTFLALKTAASRDVSAEALAARRNSTRLVKQPRAEYFGHYLMLQR